MADIKQDISSLLLTILIVFLLGILIGRFVLSPDCKERHNVAMQQFKESANKPLDIERLDTGGECDKDAFNDYIDSVYK